MSVLLAIAASFGAGLLLLAGVAKLRRPAASASAVTLVGLPDRAVLVRAIGSLELVIGLMALVLGGWSLLLLAVTYVVFTGVVVRARRQGTPCGCFGQDEDAPPTALHGVVDATIAAAAVGAAVWQPAPVLRGDLVEVGIMVAVLATGVVLLRSLLVDLPLVVDAMRRLETA